MTLGYYDPHDTHFYLSGFALGADLVAQAEAAAGQAGGQVVAHARGAATQAGGEIVTEGARRFEAETGLAPRDIPTNKDEAIRFAANEIKQEYGIDPTKIPTSVDAAYKQVKNGVERELKRRIGRLRRRLEKKFRDAGIEAITDLSQELVPEAAEALFKDLQGILGDVNIPNYVDIEWPDKATAGAVLEAAGESVLRSAEAFAEEHLGFDIPFPSSFDPEEIWSEVKDFVPGDAKEALELGAEIGIQVLSNTIAGVVAGATIGSTIPGLGTVIGIGLGILYQEAISEDPPYYSKPCPTPQSIQCPLTARQNLGRGEYRYTAPQKPIERLAWTPGALVGISRDYTNVQMQRGDCQGGFRATCINAMRQTAREDFEIVKRTVPVLGIEETEKYLKIYREALQAEPYYYVKTRSGRRFGIEPEVKREKGEVGNRFVPRIFFMLTIRAIELRAFVYRADRTGLLSGPQRADLRFELATEISAAAMQAQIATGSEARQWLNKLLVWSAKLKMVEEARKQERRVERQQRGQERFEARKADPAWQKRTVLDQLQYLCGTQEKQRACEEYRRIDSGGALRPGQKSQFQGGDQTPSLRQLLSGSVPSNGAAQPSSNGSGQPPYSPEVYAQCREITQALVDNDPRSKAYLSRTDIHELAKICTMAHGPSPQITKQKALELMATYADNVVKRKERKGRRQAEEREAPRVYAECRERVQNLVDETPLYAVLSRTDLHKMAKICARAHGPNPQITKQKALELVTAYADNTARRKTRKAERQAARRESGRRSAQPAQPAEPATPAQPGAPGQPATRAAPATPAEPATPRRSASQKKADQKAFKRCLKIARELTRKDPRASKCLTRSDIGKLAQICTMAYPPRSQISPQKALELMAVYADNVCKRKGL